MIMMKNYSKHLTQLVFTFFCFKISSCLFASHLHLHFHYKAAMNLKHSTFEPNVRYRAKISSI